MFAEMSSPFSAKMADIFADLSKDERVKLAVHECSKEMDYRQGKLQKSIESLLLRSLDG
jgi:hypothetical protein